VAGLAQLLRDPPPGSRKRVVISIYDDPGNRHYAGGGPLVVMRIAERLADTYDVVVVTGGYRGSRSTTRSHVTWVPLPLGWVGPRLGQLLYTVLLLALVPVARWDVWIESFTPPFSSSFVPLVSSRPVIGLAQALSGREMARRYRLPFLPLLERLALRAYADVVVLNEHDRTQVARCNPRAHVHHIPNVAELGEPPAVPASEGRYALYLGRVDFDQKGLGLLFDAYRQVGDGALPLVLAGSGRTAELRTLQQQLRALQLPARWLGQVTGEQKKAALLGSAFVVVPSRAESFCLAALEALAHGRPVVHFDLPQLSWIPADCGIRVACFDTAALALAVRTMSIDGDLREAASRRARAFAEEYLGSQDVDAYDRLVAEVLARAADEPAAAGRL